MNFREVFCRKLLEQLLANGLLPSEGLYSRACIEIHNQGSRESDRFKRHLPWKGWPALVKGLGTDNPDGHLHRILGFGWALTEYVSAGGGRRSPERAAIARLGMQANFIVAVYDKLLDNGKFGNPFAQKMLRISASRLGRIILAMLSCFQTRTRRLMSGLVSDYFSELAHVCKIHSQPQLFPDFLKLIRLMYEAEQQAAHLHQGCNEGFVTRVWMRKSGLPFVVMGAPSILGRQNNRGSIYSLRRCYRLGEIFGWVDDVADLEEDVRTGHLNRVVRFGLLNGGPAAANALAEKIAKKILRLNEGWQAPEGIEYPQYFRLLPIICLIDWLGGVSVFKDVMVNQNTGGQAWKREFAYQES